MRMAAATHNIQKYGTELITTNKKTLYRRSSPACSVSTQRKGVIKIGDQRQYVNGGPTEERK